MSPHQSSQQSRSRTPKNPPSNCMPNPISSRSKSDSELSDRVRDPSSSSSARSISSIDTNLYSDPSSSSSARSISSIDTNKENLDYDLTSFDGPISPNPYTYYEIKTRHCDGGSQELSTPFRKYNSNHSEMYFWSYPNLFQTNYSSKDRLCSSEQRIKGHNVPKHSKGIPFYYGTGGRGFGRSPCWNRRKVIPNIKLAR